MTNVVVAAISLVALFLFADAAHAQTRQRAQRPPSLCDVFSQATRITTAQTGFGCASTGSRSIGQFGLSGNYNRSLFRAPCAVPEAQWIHDSRPQTVTWRSSQRSRISAGVGLRLNQISTYLPDVAATVASSGEVEISVEFRNIVYRTLVHGGDLPPACVTQVCSPGAFVVSEEVSAEPVLRARWISSINGGLRAGWSIAGIDAQYVSSNDTTLEIRGESRVIAYKRATVQTLGITCHTAPLPVSIAIPDVEFSSINLTVCGPSSPPAVATDRTVPFGRVLLNQGIGNQLSISIDEPFRITAAIASWPSLSWLPSNQNAQTNVVMNVRFQPGNSSGSAMLRCDGSLPFRSTQPFNMQCGTMPQSLSVSSSSSIGVELVQPTACISGAGGSNSTTSAIPRMEIRAVRGRFAVDRIATQQ